MWLWWWCVDALLRGACSVGGVIQGEFLFANLVHNVVWLSDCDLLLIDVDVASHLDEVFGDASEWYQRFRSLLVRGLCRRLLFASMVWLLPRICWFLSLSITLDKVWNSVLLVASCLVGVVGSQNGICVLELDLMALMAPFSWLTGSSRRHWAVWCILRFTSLCPVHGCFHVDCAWGFRRLWHFPVHAWLTSQAFPARAVDNRLWIQIRGLLTLLRIHILMDSLPTKINLLVRQSHLILLCYFIITSFKDRMLLLVTDHHGSLGYRQILLLRCPRWLLKHMMLANHEAPNPCLLHLLLLSCVHHHVLLEDAGLGLESAASRGSLIQRDGWLFLVLGQDVLETGSGGGTTTGVIGLKFAIIDTSARDYRQIIIFEVAINVWRGGIRTGTRDLRCVSTVTPSLQLLLLRKEMLLRGRQLQVLLHHDITAPMVMVMMAITSTYLSRPLSYNWLASLRLETLGDL